MKITGLEARRYRVPLAPPFKAAWDPVPRAAFEDNICILRTDERIVGYAGGAPVPDVDLLGELLVGVDLTETVRIHDIEG